MRIFDQIRLAGYNLLRRKKTSAQCIAMITVILLLVFLSTFFIATLVTQLNDDLDNYASKNYFTIESYPPYGTEPDTVFLDAEMRAALKQTFSSVGDIHYYQGLNGQAAYPTMQNLIVDGAVYPGDGTNSRYVWWESVLKETDVPTFSKNLQTEFSKKFPGEPLIIHGRDIQSKNEVLFPGEFFEAYDITPEQVLSAECVTLEHVFKDAKIVGITNPNLTLLEPDENGERDKYCEIMLYAEVSVVFGSFDSEEPLTTETYQRIELNGSAEAAEIETYLEALLGDEYFVRFKNYAHQNRLETTHKILVFVQNIIGVLFGVIGVALVVFLYSVLAHGIRQKGAYLGMTRAMGLRGNFGGLLIETFILTVISAVLCFAVSFVAVSALQGAVLYFSWTMRYTITVDMGLFAAAFALSFAAVLGLNALLVWLAARREQAKTITEALRS